MSEILGHDCDGKPLRAGDRVVQIVPAASFCPPQPWTISRAHPVGLEMQEPDLDGDRFGAFPENLRRIEDRNDHQPADAEFSDWLRSVTSGVPA